MRHFAKALVRGHSGQTADDLVQETVILALRAERIVRGHSLRGWCFSNLMRLHRAWELSRGGAIEARERAAPPAAGPLAFIPREIARLDLLALEQREALLLVVLAGMTYAQAAEALHVTADTFMLRLDMARSILARGQRPLPGAASTQGAGGLKTARGAQYLHVVK